MAERQTSKIATVLDDNDKKYGVFQPPYIYDFPDKIKAVMKTLVDRWNQFAPESYSVVMNQNFNDPPFPPIVLTKKVTSVNSAYLSQKIVAKKIGMIIYEMTSLKIYNTLTNKGIKLFLDFADVLSTFIEHLTEDTDNLEDQLWNSRTDGNKATTIPELTSSQHSMDMHSIDSHRSNKIELEKLQTNEIKLRLALEDERKLFPYDEAEYNLNKKKELKKKTMTNEAMARKIKADKRKKRQKIIFRDIDVEDND
ncbi:hypothetical protein SNEBB_001948 [Seison nebaliae]|nr:hypothetical protein SNEBB_001948 [Seison nebaliae]